MTEKNAAVIKGKNKPNKAPVQTDHLTGPGKDKENEVISNYPIYLPIIPSDTTPNWKVCPAVSPQSSRNHFCANRTTDWEGCQYRKMKADKYQSK